MFVELRPGIHCLQVVQLYRRVINQFGDRLPYRVILVSRRALEFFQGNPAFYSRHPFSITANFTASPVYKYIHLFLEAFEVQIHALCELPKLQMDPSGRQEVACPLFFRESEARGICVFERG